MTFEPATAMIALLATACLAIITTTLNAEASNPLTHIRVRTYSTGIPESEVVAALYLTADIFSRAGLVITWIPCDSSNPLAPSSGECDQPTTDGELILRLTVGPQAPRRLWGVAVATEAGNVLGDSYATSEPGGGVLATVYWDRVRDAGRRSGVGTTTVLGRAVAHELGHLLLGANSHSTTGVMRPSWSRQTLQRDEDSDWRFSAAEVLLMRATVKNRD